MAPLPEDEGGTLTPAPAGIPGDADVAVAEAGGAEGTVGETDSGELGDGEMGIVDAPRESAGLGAKPDGAPEPVGTQPDAGDEAGGGVK